MRDRVRERNGVRLGQPVRDLDGASLGRVVRLFDWGFASRRGLFGRMAVARYDEVRGVRDGALVLARSTRDVFDLAAGGIPPSWRIPTPPLFPTAATPSEASLVRADVARGRITGAELEPHEPIPLAAPAAPVSDDEVRAYSDTRGQGGRAVPPSVASERKGA